MTDCINAASDTIERFCNRTFAINSYDELYDGTGDFSLLLNNYPIQTVNTHQFPSYGRSTGKNDQPDRKPSFLSSGRLDAGRC